MLRAFLRPFCFVVIVAVCITGCEAAPQPTATPTKTPGAASAAISTTQIIIAATATPLPETPTPAPTEPIAEATPLPANIAPFTGLAVTDPQHIHEKPILICVNNDPVGRSAHWGLSRADLVYEYIVDGFSLSRLTALFQSQETDRVGPVRSARMPNIWMTQMYDGVLACSGGSDEIRYLLKNEVGFPYLDADIDDPSNNRYYTNLGSDYRTRLQGRTDGVRQWMADNNLPTAWQRPGFEFSPEPTGPIAGQATLISIPYPGGNNVEWHYDATLGGYLRFQGGVQESDPATGQPILAKNVIAIVAQHELTNMVEDSLGTKGVDIKLYGFGDLRVFRDGQVYEGTWRADDQHPPRWLGQGDVVIKLKPGQSWIQVVQKTEDIGYQ
ncbi:DUF3048 domain-containing protein [soil metagenome]